MTAGPIVVLGDSLLDVDIEGEVERFCPDAPAPVVDVSARHSRPGGAGLAALLAARDGAEVVLVTAVGDDPAGHRLEELLADHVDLVRLPLRGATVRKTRVRARGQTMIRIDSGDGRAGPPDTAAHDGDGRRRPARERVVREFADERVAAVLRKAAAVLVSDYGRGVAALHGGLLGGLTAPVVWDPHPRGASPVPGCSLLTPSEAEARLLCGEPDAAPHRAGRLMLHRSGAKAVAVTLAERGAVLLEGGPEHATRGDADGPGSPPEEEGRVVRIAPPAPVTGRDSCGAGDRFAAAATLALAEGASVEDAVATAVGRATGFVRQGGAAAVRPPGPARSGTARPVRSIGTPGGEGSREAEALAAAVRATGGRVITTGGCFDLLHAGHVSLLRRARALGDVLIVCLNSDDSVRRLKGPGRPVVAGADRVEVLRALECVDAVAVFDEDTPSALIDRLRPHVWVKGGDYTGREMPEAAAVRRAGGEVVILSSVPGRSTTGLIAAAQAAS
ncbi:D-glycero-beta-D-manno-heptose 1-phosphate adenylyltransferase [Sphaerisporangium fuscum]|uniref:D-glycero-beta-D-manno-heptose 1-phosphate adenylyltransferase n=1 Tax=Sphaerisporangium fuscum TaxID=2835868 RepID=UPI001BDD4EBB|nr:D-glycero-beta-D-manno-heptose 1-phosphate adenylyltransferase [Sphaerisporangium fuscum]